MFHVYINNNMNSGSYFCRAMNLRGTFFFFTLDPQGITLHLSPDQNIIAKRKRQCASLKGWQDSSYTFIGQKTLFTISNQLPNFLYVLSSPSPVL